LRFNKDDNKNSHRAETQVGLRLMGQPSRLELITRSNSKCRCTFRLEPTYPASDGGASQARGPRLTKRPWSPPFAPI
jgi:hypothetical protein